MYSIADLKAESQEAWERVWFVRSIEKIEQTDNTLSLRLYIRSDLFVQAFIGEHSGSLYFALVEGQHRVFGIDCVGGQWHLHPYESPNTHVPFPEGLGPRPLLKFLAIVEDLLLQYDML